MEIKFKIEELRSMLRILEKEVDLGYTILRFDSYEFLSKNRGQAENKFIMKHRSNRDRFKTLSQELNSFQRQLNRILTYFETEDERLAKR